MADHEVDIMCAIAAVLAAVRSVDLVIEDMVSVHENDILVDATSRDVALMAHLNAAKPGGSAPVSGSDVEIVAVADHPNRHWLSQRAPCCRTSERRARVSRHGAGRLLLVLH